MGFRRIGQDLLLPALVLAGLAVSALPAASETLELKHGTFLPPRHPSVAAMREAADDLAAMTDGRVKVKVFDSGTLAKSTEQLDAVQRGVMDMGLYIFTYSSFKQRPFFMIGSIPFLYRDGSGYMHAWTAEPTLMQMANEFAPKYGYDDVQLMDVGYSGFARLALRNKEAKVPADLKGLKIRGTGTYIDIIKSYGGVGVTIDTPQVYGAMERGLIDGAIGLNTNWINFKWMEPATYLIDYNLAPVGETLAVNKGALNKMTDHDKRMFAIFSKLQAQAFTNQYLEEDLSGNHTIGPNMKIYEPTEAEKKLWDAPRGAIVEQWIKTVGEDVGKKAIAVVEKYNK